MDRIIWIPWQPQYDDFGHADGLVRYYDDQTVLVNNLSKEKTFREIFLNPIKKAGLKYTEIPYYPYSNKDESNASGIYINYLQVNHLILLPVYNQEEDEKTTDLFVQLFPDVQIRTIYAKEIALNGGFLNCISWSIKI